MPRKRIFIDHHKAKNPYGFPEAWYRKYNNTRRVATQQDYPYFKLFRYSTIWERVGLIIAVVLAIIGSFGVPYSVVIYGEFTSLLIDRITGKGTSTPTIILNIFGGGKSLTNATKEENMSAIREDSLAFGIGCFVGGLIEWIVIAIAVDVFNDVALNQGIANPFYVVTISNAAIAGYSTQFVIRNWILVQKKIRKPH